MMEEKKESPLFQGRNNAQRSEDTRKRKEKFLNAYEENGTIRSACMIVGIARNTYTDWVVHDFVFSKEMDRRRQAFGEKLEEIALDRVQNPGQGKGSDILLLGLLNANLPSKYRPQFAMTEDTAKDLIIEWRKAAKEVSKEAAEKPAELPGNVENTLAEILERRGKTPKEKEGEEQK
jgi:hypothetical protein